MITNEQLGYPTNTKKSKVQNELLSRYELEKRLSEEERIASNLAAERRRREAEAIFGRLEIPESNDGYDFGA